VTLLAEGLGRGASKARSAVMDASTFTATAMTAPAIDGHNRSPF
jgi:hypothetical protein